MMLSARTLACSLHFVCLWLSGPEDLNLDSEAAAEDTVGEATVSALLFGDGWGGGPNEDGN